MSSAASTVASTPEPPEPEQRAASDVSFALEPIPGHPLAAWSYAEDFEDFHDIWATRFALSVAPHPDPNALLPYADAVSSDGVSWGIDPEEIQLVFLDRDSRVCRVTGATHPGEQDARERHFLSPPELKVLGWDALQETATIRKDFHGIQVQVLGTLRARDDCRVCHTVAPEALLGVLVYGFGEIADD